jgi:hypothetical protein
MSDYIPDSDGDFGDWLTQFLGFANDNLGGLHLTAPDLAAITNLVTEFADARTINEANQAQARGSRAHKDDVRANLERLIRPLVGRIQGTAGVTDEQRQGLGITVRSTTRSAVGVPTSRPVATIDTTNRLQHTIAFVDELTPTSRAKPDGVSGCQIWTKIDGPPPTDPNELRYLATDTRSPYLADFDGGNGGKTAYYMLRWVSTRGETGPWSQTVSATIMA